MAVAAFLDGYVRFDEIPEIIEMVLAETESQKPESIEKVLAADAEARRVAQEKVEQRMCSATARPVSSSS